ncbi:MAG: hypothetical protein LBD97_06560 [Bifidobacteriaceae bacterium]|nr:hypothetical protein [Bifidobacteriaceae bacterium]
MLALSGGAYLAIMGVAMAFVFSFEAAANDSADLGFNISATSRGRPDPALLTYSIAGSMAYVFPLLIGTLSVTQEFRHRTITGTFTAEPRRHVVLCAKMLASLPMGLVMGAACVAALVSPAALVFAGQGVPNGLGSAETWAFLGRALLDFTVWAGVGVGVGALLRNQVAAIVVVLAVTQFVEPVLRMLGAMLDGWSWTRFLPGAAGDAIQGVSVYDAMADINSAEPMGFGWAALVLAAWGVGFAAIAYATTWRRDVS